jgi:hypothetical protein
MDVVTNNISYNGLKTLDFKFETPNVLKTVPKLSPLPPLPYNITNSDWYKKAKM